MQRCPAASEGAAIGLWVQLGVGSARLGYAGVICRHSMKRRFAARRRATGPINSSTNAVWFLLVTPAGGRLWRLKYRMYGREKLISLGAYPDVPLSRAREKRDEARK